MNNLYNIKLILKIKKITVKYSSVVKSVEANFFGTSSNPVNEKKLI